MALETMYSGQVNSPQTALNGGITDSATTITVADASILPPAPMVLVIGGETDNPETVLMTAKSGNDLTVTRALEGTAQAWGSGSLVGRNFTNYDYQVLINNIEDLNSGKVDKVTGKQLSTEDYTTTEKNKLSGIETGATADQEADEVPITDVGDYFISADVEGALQETGEKLTELAIITPVSTWEEFADALEDDSTYYKRIFPTGNIIINNNVSVHPQGETILYAPLALWVYNNSTIEFVDDGNDYASLRGLLNNDITFRNSSSQGTTTINFVNTSSNNGFTIYAGTLRFMTADFVITSSYSRNFFEYEVLSTSSAGTITGLSTTSVRKVVNSGMLETASTTLKGLMSPEDKTKLEGLSTVGLMPKSGGVLENYREKLTTLSGTSTTINLSLGNVFTHSLTGNTTYTISNAVSGQAHSFTLIITQTATVRTITFPASVRWQGGEIPDLTTAEMTYVLTFMTFDGGTTWLGMFGGEFDARELVTVSASKGLGNIAVDIFDEKTKSWVTLSSSPVQITLTPQMGIKFPSTSSSYEETPTITINGVEYLVDINQYIGGSGGWILPGEYIFDWELFTSDHSINFEDMVSLEISVYTT